MKIAIKYLEGNNDYYLSAESAGKVQFRVSFIGVTLMLCGVSEVIAIRVSEVRRDMKRLSNHACVKQSNDIHSWGYIYK